MLELNETQIKSIHFSWVVIQEDPEAMLIFYDYLFEIAPETRHFFDNDLTKQSDKLKITFDFLVDHIEQFEYIQDAIEKLGKFHNRIQIEATHYASLKVALLKMIEKNMGDKFNDEIEEAWTVVIDYVSEIMINSSVTSSRRIGRLFTGLFK